LGTTVLASFIRLAGGLAIGFVVTSLFGMTGVLRSVIILMSAMPAAVNTYLITARYKNEEQLVASVVLLTTLGSLALIPFLLHILG
jgi:predicted permease